MINYSVDEQNLSALNERISELQKSLVYVSESLESLRDTFEEQQKSLSSPSIDQFRNQLKRLIQQAIILNKRIAQDTHTLATVSDQAGKSLMSVESHYSSVLNKDAEQ